jgi:homoserine dehydrogenase
MALTAYVPSIPQPAKRPASRVQPAVAQRPSKIALLGFGTVGRAVAEILCREPRPELQLTHVFNRNVQRKRVGWVHDSVTWTQDVNEILNSTADVVLELIGGLDPAYEFIRRALLSGKSVVTANKHVMAKYGPELLLLAHQTGQRLEYGASVGGAVPVLTAVQQGLSGDRLLRICGILNGTCNYILSNMERNGTTLAGALHKAQQLGYAESDPSDDVNGLDAACKLAIVARSAFHAQVNAFHIPRQSILEIQPADFRYARQVGCTVRQVSHAELTGKRLCASVGPALVPLNSALGNSIDNDNAVLIRGEKSGDTLLAGKGAGGQPTAVAVVSDLLSVRQGSGAESPSLLTMLPIAPVKSAHYLRLSMSGKRSGVISAVRRILADHGIGISKVLEREGKNTLHAGYTLQSCSPATLNKAAMQLSKLEGVSQRPLLLPILSTHIGDK